jgi:hypothetical protein
VREERLEGKSNLELFQIPRPLERRNPGLPDFEAAKKRLPRLTGLRVG